MDFLNPISPMQNMHKSLVKISPAEMIVRIRGHAVILDRDLAKLYAVETKRLNQQMKRNEKRFPEDFAFQLTEKEWHSLRLQNATLKRGQHRKYMPYVFTEHGAIQAANVLRSEQAEQMSVAVVRAFVKLRRMALSVEGLARKVEGLENKYDKQFQVVFNAVRQLMAAPPGKRIEGFSSERRARRTSASTASIPASLSFI